MPNILDDNTVVPSYLGIRSRGDGAGAGEQLNDNVLRLGEVKKIIYPDTDLSYGKKTVEYEVEVQHRVGSSIYNTTTYRGVTVNTVFGGVADRFHATYRADDSKKDENEDENKGLGVGSKVLLLCLNGDQQKAIILGGVEDPNRTGKESKDFGHNLFFEFNGTTVTITDKGEFQLFHKGATDVKGHVKDDFKDSTGATIKIDEKGIISIYTVDKDTGDDQTKITWDHVDKKLELFSDNDLKTHADNETEISASKGGTIHISQGKLDINVRDEVNIDCKGVKVGKADQAWVRGTKYRQEQKQLHNKLKSTLQQAQLMAQQASIQLQIAAGLNSTPIYGGAAAQTNFQAASQALSQLASKFNSMASDISSFESSSDEYLSKDHLGE